MVDKAKIYGGVFTPLICIQLLGGEEEEEVERERKSACVMYREREKKSLAQGKPL